MEAAVIDRPAVGTLARAWGAWVGRVARYEKLLFGVLIFIHLVPIWAFWYLPTTDGAAHVANAQVMRKINDPSLPVLRHYYFVSGQPSPNLIGHLVLAGLLYVVPPVLAEKLLVSLYIVLFPLAVRYATGAIRRSARPLGFLAFPMLYSYLLGQGFYNFCLSMAAFFAIVGYWAKNRDRLDVRRGIVLFLLSVLLYLCHLFSLVMACAVLGVLTVGFSLRELRIAPRDAARQAVVTFIALVPALALAVRFKPATTGEFGDPGPWSLKEDVINLFQFGAMMSYRNAELWLGGLLASVIFALVAWALIVKVRRRIWTAWDGLLVMPVVLLVGYLKAHDAASVHFYIPQRLMFYFFLTLLLWLAGQPMTRRVRWAAALPAVVIAVGFVVSHALKYREFAPQLREFVAAGEKIDRNSTFLPLIFAPRGVNPAGKPSSVDVSPFYMASGYIAAERDAVDLRNYEANTDHFPVRFIPARNPYQELAVGLGFDQVPPKIDLQKVRRAGGEVDYVLIWGLSEEMRQNPDTKKLFEQLRNYDRVELPGARHTELWRRRRSGQ
jgi:hypothetical protein